MSVVRRGRPGTQSQHTVTAHSHSHSTQSQHTVAAHSHSTQSQHTVAAHSRSTQSQHTVAAHSHSTQSYVEADPVVLKALALPDPKDGVRVAVTTELVPEIKNKAPNGHNNNHQDGRNTERRDIPTGHGTVTPRRWWEGRATGKGGKGG